MNSFKTHFAVESVSCHQHRHEVCHRTTSSKCSVGISIPANKFTNFAKNSFLHSFRCPGSFECGHAIVEQNSQQFSQNSLFVSPTIQFVEKSIGGSSRPCHH